ncbi:hypothetical protein ACFQ0R_02375 [Psychroflexus salinarum]|uniref:Cell wall anchor protein n=1 Tax=Psychroflexus salinarum TaxID=546024 RepID=A0ABW3GRM5_9FLAO
MKKGFYFISFALIICFSVPAQVGIGTESPAVSSILDVASTESGVLLPRMTTVQRSAITDPDNGLTVFDTDTQSYYFYNATEASWESLSSSRLERDNYVLVKSQDDFPDPVGGKITLDPNTFYEINGIISLDASIELNGAYISGLDSFQDELNKPNGDLFVGNTGGTIRFLSLSGVGNAFNVSGGTSVIVQNTVIHDFSNVGTISNVNLVFLNTVQYLNNSNGIVFSDIDNLLINNAAWQASNSGTFEKFVGSFDLIQKASGFSITNGSAIAIDVSENPIVGDGVITGTVFTGTSTTKVNKYTTTPLNTNFTKNWFIQAPGIKDEYDDVATGNIYYDGGLNFGYSMTSAAVGTAFKLTGGDVNSNLLRFTSDDAIVNRLRYEGKEARAFFVNASLSVRGTNRQGDFYSFFIRVNGNTTLNRTNAIFYVDNITNVSSISLSGTVVLNPNDFVEIWAQKLTGTESGNLTIFSQNLNIN